MIAPRYAVRALALCLSLSAVAGFAVFGSASVQAAAGATPIGGPQLARAGVIVNLVPGVPAPPAMAGAGFLVADMDTGAILAARAPHRRSLPASTLKALTALTLIPRLKASAKVVIQPEDVRVEGSRIGILAGTAYTVHSLFQGLLMASGNDAAYALSRANGSIAATLEEMNAKATELGAFDTLAKDPSGLDQPGQTSSAYDLALIGRAAMKLPDFRGYVSTKRASFPGGRSSAGKMLPGFTINSHHRLLYNYEGAIGIKNGYTIAAKQTFIGAATRGGKTYIVTEMASPNGSWRPTAAMLDWAFAHGASLTPIGTLVEPGTAIRPGHGSADSGLSSAESGLASAAGGGDQQGRSGLAHLPALQPWVGLAGLLSTAGLVVVLGVRSASRRRR